MIKIKVKKQKNDIVGFRVSGHAGYAESGEDIVCAAISTLTINCINSIESLTKDRFRNKESEKDAVIEFSIKGRPSKESLLLLNSWYLGVSQIAKDCRNQYVTIINR